MKIFVTITFLFAVGAMSGWVIEFFFRKFFSSDNKEHKWVNPGFCLGPWLPLYGFGLLGLFIIATFIKINVFAEVWLNRALLFVIMAIAMTIVEFIAGEFCLKILKVKLWDYSDCWGNIDTVICPLFTVFWGLLGIVYYYAIHPYVMDWVSWLMNNQLYTFFVGMFYGVFLIDLIYSSNVVAKMRKFAKENNIVVEIENVKLMIRNKRQQFKKKEHFFIAYDSIEQLGESLKEFAAKKQIAFEERIKKISKQ